MTTISLCMIVKDEEKFLADCLNSVKGLVDEMIIVDTGSTDKTKEIALGFGAKVFDFEWCDDFAAARNESLRQAKGDWILVLDADEVIAEKDHEKIKKAVGSTSAKGFILTLRNYINDSSLVDWFSSKGDSYSESSIASGWKETKSIRIFRNVMNVYYEGIIHETIYNSIKEHGEVLELKVPIHHLGNITKPVSAEKHEFYERLSLKKAEISPDHVSYFELGNVYVRKGELDSALKSFKKSVEKKANFFDGLLMLGNVYLMKYDFENAKKVYNKALGLNGKKAVLYSGMALVFINEKNYQKAADYFIKSISLNPKNATAHYNLGMCFHLMGNQNKAYLALKNAIELNPKYKETVEFEW